MIRKLYGSKPFRKYQPEKGLPKILGDIFRVKICEKWGIISLFRCSKILGEAGKQEILQQINVPKILDLKSSCEQIFSQNWRLVPLIHTCINWIYNFSHDTARFYVVAMPRTLNWEKRRVKKSNLAPLALRVQNILVYGAGDSSVSFVLSSRMMKRQSVKRLESRQFSRILWAMFPRTYGGAREDRT